MHGFGLKGDDGAPLRKYTQSQAAQLHQILAEAHDSANFVVDWAMRYGKPSIPERLGALQQAGCNRLLILPLYPAIRRRHHR